MSATVVPIQTPLRTRTVELQHPRGEDFDDMEATDVVIHANGREQIDIGGGGILGSLYLRVVGEDLVVALERLKALCDRGIDAVMDERQAQAEAERQECYCGVLLDPEEDHCGAPSCVRAWGWDMRGLL